MPPGVTSGTGGPPAASLRSERKNWAVTINDLQAALDGLTTERIRRLADRLQQDPDTEVTVGAWVPHCPMMLAGFDPRAASTYTPEQYFEDTWNRFALPAPTPWWTAPVPFSAGRAARRADVQQLLRAANRVLDSRAGWRVRD
jgi:hypothetical protein